MNPDINITTSYLTLPFSLVLFVPSNNGSEVKELIDFGVNALQFTKDGCGKGFAIIFFLIQEETSFLE